MPNTLPIAIEILFCFLASAILLNRYSDVVKNNIVTVLGVFISWFFSFMVIFLLPADLTSTAYRQCVHDHHAPANSTTTTPLPSLSTTNVSANIPQHSSFVGNITAYNPNFSEFEQLSNITSPCVTPWNYVADRVLIKLWRFIYWTSQFLTWILLPIMQSYSMAGDFTTYERIKSAIRRQFIYYTSIGLIFFVLLVYVGLQSGLDFANLKVIAISSSNTWGLFLLVVLLGYGLIELPRFLISKSRYSESLNRQYFRVAKANADKCDAEVRLDDVLEEIQRAYAKLGNNEHHPMRRYLNQIANKCPLDWKKRSNAFRRQVAASTTSYEGDQTIDSDLTIETLAQLHRRVIEAVHYHRQTMCRWDHVIMDVIQWEDVVRNQTDVQLSSSRAFKSTLPKKRSMFSDIYTPRVEWYWKCVVRIWIFRIAGFFLAACSAAVVWSEIAFPVSFISTRLSIFALFVDAFERSQRYFYMELFSTLSIGYLAMCAFYTVFHMKIYNIYYLASNKQTDEYSLLFSGMQLCRLTAPLCLNYLCLIHKDSHIIKQDSSLETSFTTIMGHLDLIPIVNNGLNVFLPLCISAICLAIYFDIGTHVLHNMGFDQFIETDELTIDWVQNGRELVKRETTKLLRTFEGSANIYHEMVAHNIDTLDQNIASPKAIVSDRTQEHNAQISPTSGSSSSSNLSRSSLLPRTSSRHIDTGDNQAPSLAYVGTSMQQRNESTMNPVVQIDMGQAPEGGPVKKGFFDDIQ